MFNAIIHRPPGPALRAGKTRKRALRGMFASAVFLLATTTTHSSDEFRWKDAELAGDIETELRAYPNSPRWPGQSNGAGLSVATNLDLRWHADRQRIRVRPFARLDSMDPNRSHVDLREAYWAWEGDDWAMLAGFNKVFWGVAESRHLVDVINQADLVEDPDQEQKLGQPMLNLALQRDWGNLDLYLMPYFRERTYPGVDGRLRPPVPVEEGRAVFESDAKEWHTDLAARWSHYFGDVDIGLSAFRGTGREPRLIPDRDGRSLAPYYHQISQAGLDVQYTRDAWLWKTEAIVRKGISDTFAAVVAGFEYTVFNMGGAGKDVGIIAEYLYDGRAPTEPVTVYDDDLFLGARLAFNDTQDTSLLAGITLDRRDRAWIFSLEAERRLGENYLLQGKLRLFRDDELAGPLVAYGRDDYIQLSLKRYY